MKCLQCGALVVVFLLLEINNAQEVSPCPRIFVYERKGEEADRWYGVITLINDHTLNGVWIRIMFNKPIMQLGNWFGEVVKRGPTDYLIRNPTFKLNAHTPKTVRIFVRYNIREAPPQLVEFRLNGKVECPEEPLTTTPSTTTEQLFTSIIEESSSSPFPSIQPTINEQTSNWMTSVEEIENNPLNQLKLSEICGTVAEEKNPIKRTGQLAQRNEFPWHATIYYTKDITISYLCCSSLISRHHLLTVAHCLVGKKTKLPINPERLVSFLGKYNIKHWAHDGSQTRYVSDFTVHPKYNKETYTNDVAVVKLIIPVDFTDYVRPICLWQGSYDVKYKPGTVVGWGFDETGKVEEQLMFIEMYPQDDAVCSGLFYNYTNGLEDDKTFCANFIDDSVECVGDSGGGLAYPRLIETSKKPVWQLKGLNTISVLLQKKRKCDREHYVLFTDISNYSDWIQQQINSF